VKKEARTELEAEDNHRLGTRLVDDDIPDNFSKESEDDEDDTAEVKAFEVNILLYLLESN
jgi:hypothetical protein